MTVLWEGASRGYMWRLVQNEDGALEMQKSAHSTSDTFPPDTPSYQMMWHN